jgi:hypothetical protein
MGSTSRNNSLMVLPIVFLIHLRKSLKTKTDAQT